MKFAVLTLILIFSTFAFGNGTSLYALKGGSIQVGRDFVIPKNSDAVGFQQGRIVYSIEGLDQSKIRCGLQLKKSHYSDIVIRASDKLYNITDIDLPADPTFFVLHKINFKSKLFTRSGIICVGADWMVDVSLEDAQKALGDYLILNMPVTEHDGDL